jgi:transposase InsO family protein
MLDIAHPGVLLASAKVERGRRWAVLVELSVMEQRYQAVLAVVQDGWRVVEVARRLGVSRQSVHSWIARYEHGGLAALADRSHRPRSCPHQIPPELEARICELRRQHPGWGPRRIEHQLGRAGVDQVPSRSSIYRCLRRHGLIELRRRRKRREEFRRFERDRPMQLWQMDVMGGVALEDGAEAKVVTGVDDHSRFCVAASLVRRATSKAVCQVLAGALARWGIPDEILTDNGRCFTGRFGPRPVEVLFDRILRENGISHRHTGVRSPTTTGKIERFHQSLRKEFLADRTFPSLEAAQAALDMWVTEYNTDRPHQALDMATPGDRFRLTPLATDASSVPVDTGEDHPGQWVLRRVASNGLVSVDNQMFSVGNAYKAQLVDVFVDDTVIQVWSKNHLIKTVARSRSGRVRKVRADGLHVKRQPTTNRQASAGT